jgi:hypothetical protein
VTKERREKPIQNLQEALRIMRIVSGVMAEKKRSHVMLIVSDS